MRTDSKDEKKGAERVFEGKRDKLPPQFRKNVVG